MKRLMLFIALSLFSCQVKSMGGPTEEHWKRVKPVSKESGWGKQLTKEDFLNRININAKIFGLQGDNLLLISPKHERFVSWTEMVQEIERYVQQHAPEMMPEYNELRRLSGQLIQAFKIINSVVTRAISERALKEGEVYTDYIQKHATSILDDISKKIGAVGKQIAQLKNKTFILPGKRNVRDVLVKLYNTLDNVIWLKLQKDAGGWALMKYNASRRN